ncbi:hypothetical protein FKM82_004516 [Ascaphus truei]|uniref:uncharacterized protein LOC142468162 n=1 Tax=Ascaphus truei TaxID=8439 RepID=UPI003F59D593
MKSFKDHKMERDEIFNAIELAHEVDFIRYFQLIPDVVVFAWSKELLEVSKGLINMASKDDKIQQLISYDTSFYHEEYYVTCIMMRNTTLESNPIFPVAFLIHNGEVQEYHKMFISEILPCLKLSSSQHIPLAVDWRKGVIGAFKAVMPNISLVLGRNHILKSIDLWGRSADGTKDDVQVLKDNIEKLRNSESVEEWKDKHEEFRRQWSKPFSNYFERYLHQPIFQYSALFYTKKFPSFLEKASTNNVDDKLDKIIHNLSEWEELPLDCLLLGLYHLQLFYVYEFQKAQFGLGSFTLKESFNDLLRQPTEHTQFPAYMSVENIIKIVKPETPELVSSL